jgi:HEAT repeat protein
MNNIQKIVGMGIISSIVISAANFFSDGNSHSPPEKEILLPTKVMALENDVNSQELRKVTSISNQNISAKKISAQLDDANEKSINFRGTSLFEESAVLAHLKELAAKSPNDAVIMLRSLVEKNSEENNAQVIVRSMTDLSKDTKSLPNELLRYAYANQVDLNSKRVAAQILAQRGDNGLLETHISELAQSARDESPSERSAALYVLSKTASKLAAPVIEPLLSDSDASVRVDALRALEATGNSSYVSRVQPLLSDTDEDVRNAAREVLDSLGNLGENAHTNISDNDVSRGLVSFKD